MELQLKNYLDRYRYFIIKNPLVAGEIEVGLKWMSYIAAGKKKRFILSFECHFSVLICFFVSFSRFCYSFVKNKVTLFNPFKYYYYCFCCVMKVILLKRVLISIKRKLFYNI